MSVTCFPYGFQTSCSRPPRRADRPWPRCINAGPGTFSHECGAVARFVGTKADGFQATFCDAYKANGFEARGYVRWSPLAPLPHAADASRHLAVAVVRPCLHETGQMGEF